MGIYLIIVKFHLGIMGRGKTDSKFHQESISVSSILEINHRKGTSVKEIHPYDAEAF